MPAFTTSLRQRAPHPGTWLLVPLAIAAILAYCERDLLSGRSTPAWDADSFFAPAYIAVADHARAGQFWLWDPWNQGGLPACAYAEIGGFSPVTVMAALLTGPTLHGFVIYWLSIWLLGGFGMAILARHLGAPFWGGLVVALGFLFSGFFTGHAEHTSWVYSFAMLPWIIWRLDAAMIRRKARPAIEAGAIWGLSAMAGYPGVVLTTGMVAGLWALGRTLFPEEQSCAEGGPLPQPLQGVWPRLRHAAICLFLVCCTGMVVMSPTYVTLMTEMRGYSDRAAVLDRGTVTSDNALHPRALLSFSTPYVPVWSTLNGGGPRWWYTDPSSTSIYCGICVAWLALLALVAAPRSGWRWWLAGIGLLGVGLALGRALPLRGWFYDWFPPSRYFRHAAIFQDMSIFAACTLAAIASADLARRWRGPASPRSFRATISLLAPAIAAFIVGAAALVAYRSMVAFVIALGPSGQWGPWQSQADRLAYYGWGALALVGALATFAARFRAARPVFVAAVCALACGDAVHTNDIQRMTLQYDNPEVTAAWEKMVREYSTSLDLAATAGLDRKLGLTIPPVTGIKSVVTKTAAFAPFTSMANDLHLEWAARPYLYQAAIGPERIWFSRQAVVGPATHETFHFFDLRANLLGVPPMVIHPPEELTSPRPPADRQAVERLGREILCLPAPTRIAVRLDEYRPTTLAFHVDCPSEGWLMVTDRWAPGWRATINDRPAAIYGGMFIFRAIKVPAGASEIRFTYHPFGFPWLMALSYGTLALAAAASLASALRRR